MDSEDFMNDELIDDEDYTVWDRHGNRAFAFFCEHDQTFYLLDGPGISLNASYWKKIPKLSENEQNDKTNK